MPRDEFWRCARALGFAALLIAPSPPASAAEERGAVLFKAAGCAACHTDSKSGGAELAGGRALATPFGTFYGPNITPDRVAGIGAWSEAEFRRALRQGIGREGDYLFPVFPFASYTGLSDADIAALYAYLRSRPPAARPSTPHRLKPPFAWRKLLLFWRVLFFREGPLVPVGGKSNEWNRGRYLAEAVVHCQECHTPRNFLGGLERDRAYAGNPQGPDGLKVPDISGDAKHGIGLWSVEDVATLLATGQTPDFDFVGSAMSEVVAGTAALSPADRRAIAVYIKSLPPR